MRARPRSARRPGLTLLEVLLALAIFLFSLAALARLFTIATDRARDVQWQSRATRLAQSKLNEVVAGVIAVNIGDSGAFDDEPEWEWSVESESDSSVPNLWRVTVRVWREFPDKTQAETTLTQYVIDPLQRGGISQQETTTQQGTDPSQGSQTTPSSGSGSSGTPSSGTSGGGSMPSTGGSPGSSSSGSRPSGGTTPSGGGSRPSGGNRPSTGGQKP